MLMTDVTNANTPDPGVVVLKQKIHGLPAEEYVECLRERLPDQTITLAQTPVEERELLANAQIVTGHSLPTGVALGPDHNISAENPVVADNLSLFGCVYAGTGHLQTDAFETADIAVTNASGVHGPNISEHVIGGILSFARQFHLAWHRGERSEWRSFQSYELKDSTVCVLGLGTIGTAVTKRLKPFDVHTIGVRYSPEKGGPTDEVVGFEDAAVYEALARSEYAVIACPLSDLTAGLFNAEAFRTMPPEAVLINIARGPIVDTDALVRAIQASEIRGALLDVTDPEPLPPSHPLWDFENVLITPHNSGHTPQYWERLADIVAENVRRFDTDKSLKNRVI
jgi:Phosphoglycerate dehydrogenase and related dehydrogenases